jgi:hypothetical protein
VGPPGGSQGDKSNLILSGCTKTGT